MLHEAFAGLTGPKLPTSDPGLLQHRLPRENGDPCGPTSDPNDLDSYSTERGPLCVSISVGGYSSPNGDRIDRTLSLVATEPRDVLEVRPGPKGRLVIDTNGATLKVPEGWTLLEPGDAAATRRVKKAGSHWVMSEKRGRRTFGRGVWADAKTIRRVQAELQVERADPAYAVKIERARVRRAQDQERYAVEFESEVLRFLDFPLQHDDLGKRLARAIAEHAVPVGSGTVARTKRISVERRAEAATIAWMRHQTTAYDSLVVARVKGRRREVRRELAARSRELLDGYRRGESIDAARCPLVRALDRPMGSRSQ